jgi:hypothetical protein
VSGDVPGRCAIDALRPCRYCPKKIAWGIDEKGQRIPLDPVAPVYRIVRFDQDSGLYVIERAGADVGSGLNPTNYVSHFATCSGASAASKKNRTPAPRDPRAAAAGD